MPRSPVYGTLGPRRAARWPRVLSHRSRRGKELLVGAAVAAAIGFAIFSNLYGFTMPSAAAMEILQFPNILRTPPGAFSRRARQDLQTQTGHESPEHFYPAELV
jgi:hypothetical protein